MTNRKLLTFRMSPEKKKVLKKVCSDLEIRIIEVSPKDYGQKLGYLAGITGFKREAKAYRGMDFPREMIIFSGTDSKTIDLFLEEYKKTGLPKIELKASITMTNINWTPEYLFTEILQEHLSMN